jgi:hypothetical protein
MMYSEEVECYVAKRGDDVHIEGDFWLRHVDKILHM